MTRGKQYQFQSPMNSSAFTLNATIQMLAVSVALMSVLQLATPVQGAAATPPPAPTTTVAVLGTDPTALVGASTGSFTFIRTGLTNDDLIVPFVYSGTAVYGTDFVDLTSTFVPPGPRSVTIPKGFYATDLVIEPKLNPANRGNKTVDVTLDGVTLSSALAGADSKHSKAEIRIVDDTYNDSPPIVTLTSPPDNTTYTLPTTVVLTADAIDSDDIIQKVSFYAEDTFLGSATTSPFTFSWVNPDVGDYDLFARAVDSAGKSTLSQAVHIKVTGVVPTVSFSAPLDKATIDPRSNVPIQIQATGVGDLTVQVTLDSARVLAVLKKAPFTSVWTNATPGKHTLTAKVSDSVGQTASVSVGVTVVDLPPTVQITAPITGVSFVEGTDIVLTAKATDPDDTIKDVTFLANHRVVGKGTPSAADKSLYTFKWTAPKANFYVVQAVATNSNETTNTSDAVYVTVSKN